ncbi:hypothetical protein [Actinomadura verrucosospora]|uniref:hypothetical protein n=1 Tax=Actinomadura verrucosospora TaxID=46165 RepID=UPI001564BA9A|nr:hypothetical protein [Actinomadura verrucosospora]
MNTDVKVRISQVSKTHGRRDNWMAALACAAGIDRVDAGEVEQAGTSARGR